MKTRNLYQQTQPPRGFFRQYLFVVALKGRPEPGDLQVARYGAGSPTLPSAAHAAWRREAALRNSPRRVKPCPTRTYPPTAAGPSSSPARSKPSAPSASSKSPAPDSATSCCTRPNNFRPPGTPEWEARRTALISGQGKPITKPATTPSRSLAPNQGADRSAGRSPPCRPFRSHPYPSQ